MDFGNMSLEQFRLEFSTEEACIQYVYQTKWPKGYTCPRCHHRHAYITRTRRLPLYECCHCHHQTSLTANTIMEASRTELRKWFVALFLISRPEKGINAVELSTIIQVTYKTAWSILHKIRQVMSKTDQTKLLRGSIGVNSAVYGRPYHSSVNKHPQEHLLLVGASLTQTGEPTYIKIKVVTSENPKDKHINPCEMKSFTKQHIDQHAKKIDFVTGFYMPKHKRPLLTFATQASKWINDTFHGLGAAYLQTYLDEFSYRLNLSILGTPIFKHLIHQCVAMSFSHPANTESAA